MHTQTLRSYDIVRKKVPNLWCISDKSAEMCICVCVMFKQCFWCAHCCTLRAAGKRRTRQFSSICNVSCDVAADRLWSHLTVSAARWWRCCCCAADRERFTPDQQLVVYGGEDNSWSTFGHWQLHQHVWSESPWLINHNHNPDYLDFFTCLDLGLPASAGT